MNSEIMKGWLKCNGITIIGGADQPPNNNFIWELVRHTVKTCLTSNETDVTSYIGSSLKYFLFKSYANFRPPLPRFYTLLEGFFWDGPQLRRYGPFNGLQSFKTGLFEDHLELEKKSHGERLGDNRTTMRVKKLQILRIIFINKKLGSVFTFGE